jgi:hypothetical protein
MPGQTKIEPKLRLADDELDTRTTQPFRRSGFPVARERVRPNPLFRRVAELLECAHEDARRRLSPAMNRAEATPQAFTRDDLAAIAPAVLELIETVVPVEHRQRARDGLRALLEEDPS